MFAPDPIETSIVKKYKKNIWHRFIKAGREYKLINDGDRIAIDILNHKIELLGSEEEITARKAACAPSHPGRSPAISSANAPW